MIDHETKGNASNYSPNSSPSNEKDLLKLEKSKRKTMKIELRRMETEMKLLKAKEKKRASKKSSFSDCISSPLSAVCSNNGIYNDNGDDFMVDGGYDDDTFGKSFVIMIVRWYQRQDLMSLVHSYLFQTFSLK